MRRCLTAALTAALLLVLAAPALAHPRVELDAALPTDVTYAATDNVEHLGRFPEHLGTAGGRVQGDRFYLTDPRGVYVYDITTPESPQLLGSLALYQTGLGAALAQEEPDTNGEILLVDAADTPHGSAQLQVVDVSDPTNMQVLSTVEAVDHTWTCVSGIDAAGEENSCAYAYGRTGYIVDLTDPTQAELLPDTWRSAVNHGGLGNNPYVHDLTEIAPGLVMSAGIEPILMDTTDPAQPVRLASIRQQGRFTALGYHSVEWANGGRDPYVVLGTEIAPPPGTGGIGVLSDCDGPNSVIETWDAREIVAGLEAYEEGATVQEAFGDARFRRVDTYDAAGRGIFLEGQAPGNNLYCAHWMRLSPEFDAGGVMAVSYYDRGTRFVEVGEDGTMSEIGWFVPAEGYSGSPRWVSDDIVYISDYRRGLEIVRITHEVPAEGVYTNSTDLIALSSVFQLTPTPRGIPVGLRPARCLPAVAAEARGHSTSSSSSLTLRST
jgi:hypothetical protein